MLERGDSLVMYSDGLIERRGEIITDGMERLAATATDIARSGWPDRPAATFASMLSADERTDDLVVLCLAYAGVTAGRISAHPWVRHGMVCRRCTSNPSWKARLWPGTG